MILFLQIAVSLIFFVNKVFILVEKKSGWLIGAIAASLAVFYFYLIGLYVYTGLEVGLIILMGYGFFKKERKNPKVEMFIQSVTVLIMFLLTLLAFQGFMTALELVSSLCLVVGTYFLTHNKARAGWIIYAVAHTMAAVLGYSKGQQFFADFQVASVIISIVGVTTKK